MTRTDLDTELQTYVDSNMPLTYVCMPGSPYTGSTLLGFLLNNHPECASIGAATGLTDKIDVDTYMCSCGRRFKDCDFWNRIAVRTAELGRPVTIFKKGIWNTHPRISRHRWLNGLAIRSLGFALLTSVRDAAVGRIPPVTSMMSEAATSSAVLARAVLEATGKRVFVDTARDHQRPKYLLRSEIDDLKVIHLIRDPRGNTASIMKHTGVGAAKAARRWKHYNVEADRVRNLLPPTSWMILRSNDVCADPQGTLDRIARFIGVPPAPFSLDQDHQHHIIGNSMRLARLEEIREDERWKEVLTPDDLRVIARIAGAASHRFGFDWP